MKAVVRDIMSAHPVSVPRTALFKEIAARLRQFGVSGFPVVDEDGKVVGVVSEADLLVKQALDDGYHGVRGLIAATVHATERHKAGGVTADDLMTSPAVTVSPDDTVEHAARLMHARGFRRLPVVDASGRLTGILSRTDLLAVFDRPDEEIRLEIAGQVIPRLSEPSYYSVRVEDGVVTLEGTPESIWIGHEVLRQVRHVQGVVAVRNRLVYPLPPTPVVPGPYIYPGPLV